MALSSHRFRLRPFDGQGIPADLQLTGRVRREPERLQVRFLLAGPLPCVRLPAAVPHPMRRDGLWESTCLEFFLARKGQQGYREFNLSPSGDWNAYRLRGYRTDLEPDPAIPLLRPRLQRSADRFSLDLRCAPPPGMEAGEPLEMAVCAVLELRDGRLSYWALHHPGDHPDFHHREGFRIPLAPLQGLGSGRLEPPTA
jgi:hypothetical protein